MKQDKEYNTVNEILTKSNSISKKDIQDLKIEIQKINTKKSKLYEYLNDFLDNDNFENAIKSINASLKPVPEGYSFSNYVIQGSKDLTTTSNPKEVISAIKRRLHDSILEVTALFKNPLYKFPDDKAILERSIFYGNLEKGIYLLEGHKISTKIDPRELVNVIMSYQK